MDNISQQALDEKVHTLLQIFNNKRIEKLQNLELRKVLKRKNPYLYRATSTNGVSDLIKKLLDAHISSSDETMFGSEFFEPIALWIAQEARSDECKASPEISISTSAAEGCDLEISLKDQHSIYAIKSGTSVFNASSKKRQQQDFISLRKRLNKTRRFVDMVIAYAYGRRSAEHGTYREIAGQAFWQEISGDEELYLRIMSAIEKGSAERAELFHKEYNDAVKRFAHEIILNFSTKNGELDWEALVRYNNSENLASFKWKS